MTNQTDPQYKLRMPPDLRDKLKASAKENHRSMNAEMVARLQESFESAPDSGLASDVKDLRKKLDDQNELLTTALRALRNPQEFKDAIRNMNGFEDNDQ